MKRVPSMSANWGKNLQLSIFGESHGPAVGISIAGLPPGLSLDLAEIGREMARRAPGKSPLATARSEADTPEILSGLYMGRTSGAPLCAVIASGDTRSQDYESRPDLVRPGHGDYPGAVRYRGFNDPRGGGHFSGRLTAPIVFAGAVCKQILAARGVYIGAHILRVGTAEDALFDPLGTGVDAALLRALSEQELPVLDESRREPMRRCILEAKTEGDSVGGEVECVILGLDAGVGEPFFDSVVSIPGVKGVEFGLGFAHARSKGSQCNDAYRFANGAVVTETNRCGGVAGGLTTGMPVVFRAAMRPTPSIGLPQRTVSLARGEDAELRLTGRHDPCIVPRALPVVEAMAAIGILELIKEREACEA
jgi:chorismate synthase